MAKIAFVQQETEGSSQSLECIEVRPWDLGGASRQEFLIGSGSNFDATTMVWLEISYTVQGVQVFYTRNFLQHFLDFSASESEDHLELFARGERDFCGFGGMLPETSLGLTREKVTQKYPDGEQEVFTGYKLEISVDMGAVFGAISPGERMLNLVIKEIALEDGVRFMRDLIHELDAVHQGAFPDVAAALDGLREWPFVRQLNRQAYDLISVDYREKYFEKPLLVELFEAWLDRLPQGGHLLDAGCGHGDPVITRLLERGFRVTGTDLSPSMLRRARENFPGVPFLNIAVHEIQAEAEFDGACSLSSVLYLDPIDLSHSLYRVYQALKPGGWLFLFANDLHPSWRGAPYRPQIKQWMWSWTYNIQEATRILEQQGRFKVIETRDITTQEEKEARRLRWLSNAKKQIEELANRYPPELVPQAPDETKIPTNLAYEYIIIAQRQPEKALTGQGI